MSQNSRLADWNRDLKPQNSVQAFLVIHAVAASLKLDDLREIEAANIAHNKHAVPEDQRIKLAENACKLGHELIDPATDTWLDRNEYRPGHIKYHPDRTPPRPPDLVVMLLEATAEGCRWLAGCWSELLELLDEKLTWGTGDERKAIRLLGKDSEMQEDNADVRTLRLAIAAANEQYIPQIGPMTEENLGRPVPTKSETKDMLREICNRQIGRLRTLESIREQSQADNAARYNFDASAAGKELRRNQAATYREMMKSLEQVTEMQKRAVREEAAAAKASAAAAVDVRAVHDRPAHGQSGAIDRTSPRPVEEPPPTPPAYRGRVELPPCTQGGSRGVLEPDAMHNSTEKRSKRRLPTPPKPPSTPFARVSTLPERNLIAILSVSPRGMRVRPSRAEGR